MEFLLFFNPQRVYVPHFVHTHNHSSNFYPGNSGLAGMLYMNFYGGVKYLNKVTLATN